MLTNKAIRNRYAAQLVLTRHQEQLVSQQRLQILMALRQQFHMDPEDIVILKKEAPEAAVELAYTYETKVIISRSLFREIENLTTLITNMDAKIAEEEAAK